MAEEVCRLSRGFVSLEEHKRRIDSVRSECEARIMDLERLRSGGLTHRSS